MAVSKYKWSGRDAAENCISRIWQRNRENVIPFFDYPDEIRKTIDTTIAVESLNSVACNTIVCIFPKNESAMKIIYTAIQKDL